MTVFGPSYADAYDALYKSKNYVGECDMLESLLAEFGRIAPPWRLLDFGCGTGGHGIELAHRGNQVTGIDCSSSMLAVALEKSIAANLTESLFLCAGDVRDVRLDDRSYDAAIMMFAVLSYQQTDADVRAALSTVRAHLRPGAAFVFDVWHGPAVLLDRPSRRVATVDTERGRVVRRADAVLDVDRNLCAVRYDLQLWRGEDLAESVWENHVMRYFFPDEIKRFAADCDFTCCAVRALPDWRFAAPDKSWTMAYVVRAN